jgi:IrrE N-terminal-like domain
MKKNLVPEAQLEAMICEQVAAIKIQHPCWSDPEMLCKKLGIRVVHGRVGIGLEGAAFADAIQLDPTAGVPARRRFTFYHEIVHHLLREHAPELFSIINDQYESDKLLTDMSERLCNVGAAEFLLPRDTVRSLYLEEGFSVALIEALSQPEIVSRVAACAQLAFCAPHSCMAVVCRKDTVSPPLQTRLQQLPTTNTAREIVKIDVAFRSSKMKYSCASGTVVSSSHLLAQMFEAAHGERIQSNAAIPFKRSGTWKVECEAVRLGKQVFGFFHMGAPPTSIRNQLRLPF